MFEFKITDLKVNDEFTFNYGKSWWKVLEVQTKEDSIWVKMRCLEGLSSRPEEMNFRTDLKVLVR